MKYHIIILVSLVISFLLCDSISHAAEPGEESPLTLFGTVYPEKIHYGDVFFLSMKVKNTGSVDFALPRSVSGYSAPLLPAIGGVEIDSKFTTFFLSADEHDLMEGGCEYLGVQAFDEIKNSPGTDTEISFRAFWFPQPEDSDLENVKKVTQWAQAGHNELDILWSTSELWNLGPYYDFEKGEHDLRYDSSSLIKFKTKLTILDRPEKTLGILNEWYLELPTTYSDSSWSADNVFCNPYYARKSPYRISRLPRNQLTGARAPFNKEYRAFFASMETRTPESLERIKRTNELASQLLKLPDEQLSV